MHDTFKWTRETINEFFDSFPDADLVQLADRMEQFKSSKSPKKEWEIVAYFHKPTSENRERPVLVRPDTKYWDEATAGNQDYGIWAVKRNADGEVFSVGDRINGGIIQKIDTTTSSMDGIMFRTADVSKPISCAEKLPQPILTTVDGVEIFDLDNFRPTVVFDDWSTNINADRSLWETGVNHYGGKLFSSNEVAQKYILENKPLLSLNNVKEVCNVPGMRVSAQTDILIEKLTALVKQKLNQ